MRNNFAEKMTELAAIDQELVLLYGDSGNRLFNPFKEVASDRAINAGIAEANMVSVAAGMAMSGMKPVTYAITPFASSRCFEQIKVDVAYQNLPVVIVGTGSGLAYANLGPTHHSFEDIAIVRTLPNMQIVVPSDSVELKQLLPQVIDSAKPTYFRIGKKREPNFTLDASAVTLGVPTTVKTGDKVIVLNCGGTMSLSLDVAAELENQGISTEVVSFHTVKPLNAEYLKSIAETFEAVIVIEEHGNIGGLGSSLLEFYSDHNICTRLLRFGIPDQFIDRVANQKSGWKKAGLETEAIVPQILASVQ